MKIVSADLILTFFLWRTAPKSMVKNHTPSGIPSDALFHMYTKVILGAPTCLLSTHGSHQPPWNADLLSPRFMRPGTTIIETDSVYSLFELCSIIQPPASSTSQLPRYVVGGRSSTEWIHKHWLLSPHWLSYGPLVVQQDFKPPSRYSLHLQLLIFSYTGYLSVAEDL